MLETLSVSWDEDLTWEECIHLCERLTKDRAKIKKRKGIKGARMKCSNCDGVHEMEAPPIGIRSMLFALKNQEIIDDESFKSKDLEWKRYMRKHNLDFRGKPKGRTRRVTRSSHCG